MKLFVNLLAGALLAGAGMAQAADMTVGIEGLKNANGQVLVAVFDRAADFLKQPVRVAAVTAQQGKVRVSIAGLPAGDYALSVFQDENGNGKLDKNVIGMPVEPYGFSNDAAGSFGPPSFQDAAVRLADTGGSATITLR
ncbi:DUF2141 domain-containing protein [Massilia sp. YMA4]|uniref:DUF2141 domain-containing protein n=1 Tax=Massilia sp. YMA4 TaxID=1593482 RepID=UPI000DD0F1D8|nr:DUF2141 domain-containing protein [Massilia sp. YMA4]AXA93265.1 DUF2141 domain-containing protein [Massilia sp. YMA4]